MKLTGKAKEDFEKWFLKNDFASKILVTEEHQTWDIEGIWHELPQSMQYGVYVDWFDSVGIDVSVSPWRQGGEMLYLFCAIELGKASHYLLETSSKSRPEARAKAIEKANQIYNN